MSSLRCATAQHACEASAASDPLSGIVIGLVTYAKFPDLTEDDRPLIAALAAAGLEARPVCWDDAQVRWTDFQALVLRSAWDYHLRAGEFRRWLALLERMRVPLWNPVPLVRWNMHKSYLREMGEAGVVIPRTRWVEQGERITLSTILREERWPEAVVKPAISASATDTWRAAPKVRADATRFTELLSRADVLVQEMVPEIILYGEWSLVFIGGSYSHALIKRPAVGDFRVQAELGGSADPAEPPSEVIAAGETIMRHLPHPTLFARIDGVTTTRGFMLMEIECIEPHLFFATAPGSRQRFVTALRALLAG